MVQTREERHAKKQAYNREYRAANRDKLLAYNRAYDSRNLDRKRAYRNCLIAPGFTRSALMSMRSKYNMTLVMYHMLLDTQGGQCAICSHPFDESATNKQRDNPHIDHCHETGRVRG